MFRAFPMRDVDIVYTVGGNSGQKPSKELVIGNWSGGWPEPRPLTATLGLDLGFE